MTTKHNENTIKERFEKEFAIMKVVGAEEVDGVFVLESDREKVLSFFQKELLALAKEISLVPEFYTDKNGYLKETTTDYISTLIRNRAAELNN